MNASNDRVSPPTDELLDLLADGELSESQRRELLSRLDHVPDGWRRCALAFLEAQAWGDAMTPIPAQAPPSPATVRPARGRGFPGGVLGTLAAMAASFAVALLVGSLLQDARPPGRFRTPSPDQIADRSAAPDQAAPQAGASHTGPWRLVTVPVGGGDGRPAGSIRLPAIERERIDEQWLNALPPVALPEEFLQALRQSGHHVEAHRELLPMPIEGGRQLVVPVDEFDVHFVGNSTFQ